MTTTTTTLPHHHLHHQSMFDNKSNGQGSHMSTMMMMMNNNDDNIDIENFTKDFQHHCHLYRTKFDTWIENQMTLCNVAVERHNTTATNHQDRIDQTMQTLLAWQLQDGLTINNSNNAGKNKINEKQQRETLHQKQVQVQNELDNLQVQLDQKKMHLQDTDLKQQEYNVNIRVNQVKDTSQHIQSVKQIKINELTKSINNYYKYLGLDFEKDTDNEQLRFSFTQLDPDDPERRFSFHLATNERDDFVVQVITLNSRQGDGNDSGSGTTTPNIFEPVIQALKETEDLSAFVRDMRKAFLHQLHVIRSMTSKQP